MGESKDFCLVAFGFVDNSSAPPLGAGTLAALRKNVVLLAAQAATPTEPSIPQGSGHPRQRPSLSLGKVIHDRTG
jgi:hypothetical protein